MIYTVVLKPATPMNIVIGGASGAMPPLLGWAAITGQVGAEALVLFLIIFIWTPPHFWALACYRCAEYAKSGLPMLPVTHGIRLTCLHSLLYVVMLTGATIVLLHFNHLTRGVVRRDLGTGGDEVNAAHRLVAVSYTHLDVYKRQVAG